MQTDAELLLLFTGLHVIGLALLAALFVMFLRSEVARPVRPPGASDGGDGGGGDRRQPRPQPGPRGGGLPLPDAVPARARLRDHRRLRDAIPTSPRRPAREPQRDPARASSSPRARSAR